MLKHRARGLLRSLGLLVLVVALSAMTAACLPVGEDTTDSTTGDTTDTTTEESTSGSSMILTIVMYAVVIGGLFYFLLIRPQRTRQKKAQELQSSLSVGDEVQTIGGIYGNID